MIILRCRPLPRFANSAKYSPQNGQSIAQHESGGFLRFLAAKAFRGEGMVQANKGQCECARLIANIVRANLLSPEQRTAGYGKELLKVHR